MKGRSIKRLSALALVCCILGNVYVPVSGATLQEIQEQKEKAEREKEEAQEELETVRDDIDAITEEAEALSEEIEELDAELVDLILSVDLLEQDIVSKENDIEITRQEFEEAQNQVASQEEAMKKRIKFMYEKGQESYLELLIESKSMAEAVNKMEYSEKLYAYDRLLLEQYQIAKQEVAAKELQLQEELSELEEIREELYSQKEELNALIEEKRETAEDFGEQLAKAKKKAGEYETKIKKESENLKKINREMQEKIAEEARKKALEEAKKKAEEAARKKAQEEAAKSQNYSDGTVFYEGELSKSSSESGNTGSLETTTTGDNSDTSGTTSTETGGTQTGSSSGTTVTATGSGLGTDIANYALQFVGNPYVAGGTSLTNGCDCSGFTQEVYAHFGIKIPRSSYAQSEGGVAVSYDQIQSGDILYYGGHVGIYIGNGQIVHASTAKTGIKVSSASYRSIVTIRRYY